MASGVTVDIKCRDVYDEVKMTKSGQKKRAFMVMKLAPDLKEIVLDFSTDEEYGSKEGLDELMESMPSKEGRYVIYDYCFTSKSGAPKSKLLFLTWCPDCMDVKNRMLMAASKSAVKKMMGSDLTDMQYNSMSDIVHSDILQKVDK